MMTQGFYTKWILGGIALLIMTAVACFFWYRHDTAYERQQAAKSAEVARQWEASQKVDNKIEAEQAADVVSVESEAQTAEKLINERTGAETDKSTDETTNSVTASTQETENTKEVGISPNWFIPYPQVPDDYPLITPFWMRNPTAEGIPLHAAAALDLLDIVLVKLWIQGDKNIQGAATSGGKIYVYYPDVIYVKYENVLLPNGKVERRIRRTLSGPSLGKYGPPHIRDGTLPAHIKLVDFDNGGIDPHIFLKEDLK